MAYQNKKSYIEDLVMYNVLCFMDIEGDFNDVLEVACVVYHRGNGKVVPWRVFGKPRDTYKALNGAKYCHGIHPKDRRLVNNQAQIAHEVRNFLSWHNVEVIIGHDGAHSPDYTWDNLNYLKYWGMGNIPYLNHFLPEWKDRVHGSYHQAAHKWWKDSSRCQLHTMNVKYKGSPETLRAKEAWGAHCALKDSYELFLFHFE